MGKNKKMKALCIIIATVIMMPQVNVGAAQLHSRKVCSLQNMERYYGDLDSNGKITVTDLSVLNQAINGKIRLSEDEKKRADLNGDGKITKADLDLMNQFISGEIDEFPVESQRVPIEIIPDSPKVNYTLIYDANGGSGAPTPQTAEANSEVIISKMIPKKYYTVYLNADGGSVEKRSVQVKAKFIGWNTKRDGTGRNYLISVPYKMAANTTLYACYESGQLGNEYGDIPIPYKSGYTFKGWYLEGAKVSVNTKIGSNCTFMAHWEKNQSIQTRLSAIDITTEPYKTVYSVGEPLQTEGMVVTARYSDGTSKRIAGYRVSGNTDVPGNQQIQVSYTEAGVTKKAYFYIQINSRQVEKKTLIYDANGGNNAPDAQVAEINSKIMLNSVIPEKYYTVSLNVDDGFIEVESVQVKAKFVGWNTSRNGTGQNYLPGTAFKITADTTLYARYESGCLGDIPTPFKDGYTFLGWYYGSSKATANTKIGNDCSLTACWEKDMHKHTPGEWKTIVEATSTEYGIEVKECTKCGVVLQENIIPMLLENSDITKPDQNQSEDDIDINQIPEDDPVISGGENNVIDPEPSYEDTDSNNQGVEEITETDLVHGAHENESDKSGNVENGESGNGESENIENGNGESGNIENGNIENENGESENTENRDGENGNVENENSEDRYQENGYAVEWNVSSAILQKGKSTTAVKVYVTGDDEIVKYKSSKPSVVKVNAMGKIQARKVGKAIVTAVTKHGNRAIVRIRVQRKPVITKKLTVDKKKIKLKPGRIYGLDAAVTPITSSQKIRYMSSNTKVAVVNTKGKVKAKKKGTAVIKVISGKKVVKVKVLINEYGSAQ